jgi:hypothetical protein
MTGHGVGNDSTMFLNNVNSNNNNNGLRGDENEIVDQVLRNKNFSNGFS